MHGSLRHESRQRVRWTTPVCDDHFSFPYDFYQYSLLSSSVELSIKDLFPSTKIQSPLCDCHYYLSPHYLSLYVRIGIVFASIVVAVLVNWFVRRQFLQPRFIIVVKPSLVIVDKDRRRDVHGVHQGESFLNAALEKALLHLRGNIDESAARRNVEPEFFSVAFHKTDYLHALENAEDQVILRRLTPRFRGREPAPLERVPCERWLDLGPPI